MLDVNIQFHATVEEMAGWVRKWVDIENVHLTAMTYSPFSLRAIAPDELASVLANASVDRLCFLKTPPNLALKNKGDFEDEHPDQLVLEIGRLSSDGLGQSWLTCRTDNPEAIMTWRRIARDLKANSYSGVTGINRQSGVSAFYRSFRYTEGAKALERSGTAILPPQGPNGPLLRLGDASGEENRQ